jgi:hypothetical protein
MVAKVFLPQETKRFDATRQAMVPAFDFSAAAQFGQLTTILDQDDDPLFLARITPKIRAALSNFKDGDYFLAVGDPAVIAVCSGIIMLRHRKMNLLKWDRRLRLYVELEITL